MPRLCSHGGADLGLFAYSRIVLTALWARSHSIKCPLSWHHNGFRLLCRYLLRQVVLNNRLKIIHGAEIDVTELFRIGFDIAGNRNITSSIGRLRASGRVPPYLTDNRQRLAVELITISASASRLSISGSVITCIDFLRQHGAGPLTGTVGDHHVFYAVLVQVTGHQFDGFPAPTRIFSLDKDSKI